MKQVETANYDPVSECLDARSLLRLELQKRLATRPRYSLRAFAKALKVSPATLSLILSGKLEVSDYVKNKTIDALNLTEKQIQFLLNSPKASKVQKKDRSHVQEMTWDIFSVLSEWYHFAILSLLELKDSTLDPDWITKKLGIPKIEATAAVARLKRLGLVTEVNGRWTQSQGHLRVPPTLSTSASKKFQRQLLMKAIDSLDTDPADVRDITSMTFAMDPKLITHASNQITEFRRSLTSNLEAKSQPTSVYNLTIQLYPVTKE